MEDKNKDFITDYFAWVSLSEQKDIVEKLENITKDSEKERNNEKNKNKNKK